MKKVLLVKLGGSVITDKKKPYTAKASNIKSLARTIGQIHKNGTPLILGTGAGSFGHYPVLRHKIDKEVKTKAQLLGFALTHSRVTTLNGLVVEALLKEGVPAIAIHPSSVIDASGGKVKSFYLDTLIGALRSGLVPVVYGDVVLDEKRGGVVVSTETIFEELAKRLPRSGVDIARAIYVSNTPGVLDQSGRVIPRINRLDKLALRTDNSTNGYDVTGGMQAKVDSAIRLARKGISVYIVGANPPKGITQAAKGDSVGTRIS